MAGLIGTKSVREPTGGAGHVPDNDADGYGHRNFLGKYRDER